MINLTFNIEAVLFFLFFSILFMATLIAFIANDTFNSDLEVMKGGKINNE